MCTDYIFCGKGHKQLTFFQVLIFTLLTLQISGVKSGKSPDDRLIEVGFQRACGQRPEMAQGGVEAGKYLYWEHMTRSGLGDRMINLLAAQAIAWYECKSLLVRWPKKAKGHGRFPSYYSLFRPVDGLLVLDGERGKIPQGIKPEQLNLKAGFGLPANIVRNIAARSGGRKQLSLADAIKLYNALGQRLVLNRKVTEMISSLVPKVRGAIGLHIRRGDKTFGKEAASAAGISTTMLEKLENTTTLILEEVLDRFPGITVFIASDTTFEKSKYSRLVVKKGGVPLTFRSKGHSGNQRWVSYTQGVHDALADIALLAHCSIVLQSSSMSSFSTLAAAMGNGKLINLLPEHYKCKSKLCNEFKEVSEGFIIPWEHRNSALEGLLVAQWLPSI